MPKMKTHKGTAKRFKITGTGKILRGRAFGNHLLEGKSPQRRRRVQREDQVSKADVKRVKRLLGS
jgi:large subunit ribosomal protein L35